MTKMITLQRSLDDKVKTPQVKVLLKTLEDLAGVGNAVEFASLIKAVDENPDFVSRQGAAKVIRFYEKQMVAEGLVIVEGTDKPEPGGKPVKSLVSDGDKADKPERRASKRKKDSEHGEHSHAAE